MQFRPRPLTKLTGAAFFALFAAVAARADVTMVMTSTTTGTLPGPRPMKRSASGAAPAAKPESATSTTTMYFQGHKVRIESENTAILYDADAKTRYILNISDKTYSVGPSLQGEMPQLGKMLDIKTTVAVAPTGNAKMVLGQNTKEYAYSEDISLGFKAGAFAPAGNAAPKPAAPKAAPMPIMVIKVRGQQWVGSVPGLPGNTGDIMADSSGLSQVAESLPGLKALSDQLKNLKGYPLASHQSVTMTGMGIAAAMGQGNAHMTVDTVTTAIRQTPLAKSLFALPAGYKRVEASSVLPKGGMRKQPEMPF